jgi:ketosteroid isomerase-like protein
MSCQPLARYAWIVTLAAAAALAPACAGGAPRQVSEPETSAQPPALAPAQVKEAARGAVEQYRQAYELLTFDGLAPLYVHGPEVEVISQGARHKGWDEVESYLRDLLERANEVRVRVGDLRVIALGPKGAIATAEIERSVRGPVLSVNATGVLSLTFRLEDGRWLIVSEHLSYTTER